MTFGRVRDVAFLVVGLGGMIYQQVTESYNATLVGAYLSLLMAPAATGAWTLVRNGLSQPSSSLPSPLPPPSPTSLSKDGGEL